MLNFTKKIYYGKTLSEQKRAREKLAASVALINVFVVCILQEENDTNLLHLFHSVDVFNDFYVNKKFLVLAIANGKNEAKELVVQILQDYISTGKDFNDFKNFHIRSGI